MKPETSHIEGDWKEFTFKLIKKEDYSKVFEHLRKTFYRDEPHMKLFGFSEKMASDCDRLVLSVLEKNDLLSFYVEEKKTGKIAGVRITHKISKDDHDAEMKFYSPAINFIVGLLVSMSKESNLFERFNTDHYAEFLMASVDPEFRGKGIATEMYKRNIQQLRALNYVVADVICSSPFTRRATAKLGFEELHRIYFKDYVDEDGNSVLPEANNDDCSTLMIINLQ